MTHTSNENDPQGLPKQKDQEPKDPVEDLLNQLSEYEDPDLSSLWSEEDMAALATLADETNELDLSSLWSDEDMIALAKLADDADKLDFSAF